MSKCDLSIDLDRPDRTFRPGETVRGRVRVRTDAAVQCKKLTVGLQWRTHGRGNVRSGTEQGVMLFEGGWGAGEDQSYTFELQAPHGPATYHGQLLNVDHYVTARADVPWSLDPKAEIDILLPPERGTGYDHGPTHKPGPPDIKMEGAMTAVLSIIIAGIFGLPGLGMLLLGVAFGVSALWRGQVEHGIPALFLIPFGAVFAGVGFGVALMLYKRNLAQRRLGTPTITVQPDTTMPGERVAVQVTLTPRADVTLTRAVVVFRGQERVVSGSGTNRTTHTRDIQSYEVGLDLPSSLRGGSPISRSVTLELPADAAPTFVASDNQLTWAAVVHIGIAGWPDWEREYPITVTP